MRIIPEEPRHRSAVLAITRLAFKGEEEARLIENLDRDGDVIASLVAVDDAEVLGHILFSRLDVIVEGRECACRSSRADAAIRGHSVSNSKE